jgi:hypothetical protein
MVKAKEFTAITRDNIGYDIVEDIYQFMLNDGEFFRKNFFPIAKKYSDHQSEMQQKDHMETWNNCVSEAINKYFEKFKINGKSEKIINSEDRVTLTNKIVQGLSKHPVKNAQ